MCYETEVPSMKERYPDVIFQENPCTEVADTSFIMVYYLAPEYVTGGIHRLLEEDDDLFELAIIHHDDVDKMRPQDFQQRFNDGVISDEGYIIIK